MSAGSRRETVVWGLVLVAGIAAVLAGWLVLGGEDRDASPAARGQESVPEGVEVGLDPLGPSVEELQLCAPPPGEPARDGCRITAALDETAAPKVESAAQPPPAASLPALSPRRPTSFGTATLADAADPFVLVDGQTYFVFSTSAQFMNVPVAVVPSAQLERVAPGSPHRIVSPVGSATPSGQPARSDAMPVKPQWATDRGIWAPAVARFQGRYVMYFAAQRPNPPDPQNSECVGRAFAERPEGPYSPEPAPFTCGLQQRLGALDPSVVVAPDGRSFLHVAFGGTSTPLWSVPLAADGGAAGPPTPLLGFQQRWESWFLENPSMVIDGDRFILAYSAGDWRFPSYSTGLARCRSATGACVSDPAGPWLSSAGGLTGPGGFSFFTGVDGRLMAAHHGYRAGAESLFGGRDTYVWLVRLEGDAISLE